MGSTGAAADGLGEILLNLGDGLLAQLDLVSRCLTTGDLGSQQRGDADEPSRLQSIMRLRGAVEEFKAGMQPTLQRRSTAGSAQSAVWLSMIPEERENLVLSNYDSEPSGPMRTRDESSNHSPSVFDSMYEETVPLHSPRTTKLSFSEDMQLFSYQSKFLGQEDEDRTDDPSRLLLSRAPGPWYASIVMNPNWRGWKYWDFLVITLVTFDSLFLPIQLAFKEKEHKQNHFEYIYLWIVTAFFGVDMFFQFFIAFEDSTPGSHFLVVDRNKIACRYLRGSFLVDLLSTMPWWWIAEYATVDNVSPSLRLVQLIRCFRVMRLLRFAKLAKAFAQLQRGFTSLNSVRCLNLLKMLSLFFYICHWNACTWWIVGKPRSWLIDMLVSRDTMEWFAAQPHWTTLLRTDGTGESWRWVDRTHQDVYIFCCYWTLGVMRTMPSEVTPLNHVERIYLTCFMFFAFSAFAISIASVTTIFKDYTDRQKTFDEDMAALKMYMKKYDASDELQQSCEQFLVHLFNNRRLGRAEENRLLEKLPQPLWTRIKIAQVEPYMQLINIFNGMTATDLLPFVDAVELKDLVHGEVICRRGFVAAAAWVLVSGRFGGDIDGPMQRRGSNINDTQVIDDHCLEDGVCPRSLRTVDTAVCSQLIRVDREKFIEANRAHNRYKLSIFSKSESMLVGASSELLGE